MEDDVPDVPDVPNSVILFRKILNQVKRGILEGDSNVQDLKKLDERTDRIIQFGNIVISLLNKSTHDTQGHAHILALFKENGFDIAALTSEEHMLCRYYVNNDIHVYTYDLSPTHIDKIIKKS